MVTRQSKTEKGCYFISSVVANNFNNFYFTLQNAKI
jgi:hypothetical protein